MRGEKTEPKAWSMRPGGHGGGETLTRCLMCKPAAWTGRSSGRGSNLEERGEKRGGEAGTEKVRQATSGQRNALTAV